MTLKYFSAKLSEIMIMWKGILSDLGERDSSVWFTEIPRYQIV
jgi:hypothetical protein